MRALNLILVKSIGPYKRYLGEEIHIRDGTIPVSVSEISAYFSVSAVSVSAIKKWCRYADTQISAVKSVLALK